jgi:hypothetical protein
MRTLARRLAAVATTTIVAGGATLVAPPAQAATNDYAASAASWLIRQLDGGLVHNDQFDVDDHGLSLDVYFALKSLGRPDAASSVIRALRSNPGAYIGAGTERFAGATGKLATAVQVNRGTPRSFGGVNLIARLQQLVDTTHAGQVGRAVDRSSFGEFSNTIGQAWVVRALVRAESPLADEAVRFLLQQQCTTGFFREGFEAATSTTSSFTCDAAGTAASPSIDTTALALQALVSARADGVTGLDDDIAQASGWLLTRQAANGSFVGNDTANTNTTGLAAAALAVAGYRGAAERAAAYVSRLQVTTSTARRFPRLRPEVGAIAYDPAAFAVGRRAGIPVELRDQWRRATAQAAIGVNAVRILRVGVPVRFVHAGRSIVVRLAGLQAGERWTLRVGTAVTVQGNASATGTAARRVTLPRGTRTYVVRAAGSVTARTGTARLRVLGARTLRATLRHTPAERARTQRVTVSRLAAREPVRIYYRGARIFTGRASATGRVAHTFRVGTALGLRKLHVRGAFADRSRTTYFRVVR